MAKSSTLKAEFSALRTRSLRCFCPSRVRKRATTVQPGNQLTNEQRSGTNGYKNSYSWDPVGNRSTKVTSAGTTNNTVNAANELTVSTPPTGAPTTSSYDGNGNITLENTGGALTSYSWDSENRMLSVVDGSGSTTNTYNADGLRQSKNVAGTVTNYLWDGQNVLAELDAGLVIQAVYTDLPEIWGSAFSLRRSGASSFYLPDHQGNTRQLAGSAQTVTDTLLTDAWGVELAATGTTVNPYRAFGAWGYYRDTAARLYVRARQPEVAQGRWLSRDPMRTGSDSRYRYARSRPIAHADPSGKVSVSVGPRSYSGGSPGWGDWFPKCCCGSYLVDAVYRINDGSDRTGYLIQHVKATISVIFDDPTQNQFFLCNYLEAFPIEPDGTATDTFMLTEWRGSRGTLKQHGDANYFLFTPHELRAKGFGPNGTGDKCGAKISSGGLDTVPLPLTGGPPTWFFTEAAPDESVASRQADGHWKCIGDPKYWRSTTTATPSRFTLHPCM